MNKSSFLVVIICTIFFSSLSYAKGQSKKTLPSKFNINSPRVYVIDNFEDGTFENKPAWWSFGDLTLRVKDIEFQAAFTQRKSLLVKGETKDRQPRVA